MVPDVQNEGLMSAAKGSRTRSRKTADLGTVALAATLTELLKTDREGALRVVSDILEAQEAKKEHVDDLDELIPWFQAALAFSDVEAFAVVFLDTQRRVLAREVFCGGSITRTTLYPRQVFSAGFVVGATSFVISHNHPGGTLDPSPQDRELTRRMSELGEALEMRLIDHVIVTATGSRSFRRAGWL